MAKVISGGQQGEPSEKAGRGRGGGGWFRGKVKFAVIGVAILCAVGIFAGKNDDMNTLVADESSEAASVMQDVTVGTTPDSMPADDVGTVPVDSNAVEITDVRLDVDDRDRPIVLMSVTWTNNDDRGRYFQSTVTCDVSQAGETLSSASSHSEGISDRVEPGETIVATCGYRLVDTSVPIDVKLAIPSDENDSGISQSFELQSLEGYISVGDSNIGSSHLSIDGAAITTDPSGKPQISVTAAWTNNDLDPSAFTFVVSDIAKQGDVKLTANHDDAAREDVPFAKTCSIVLSYKLDNYDAPVHCEFSKHGADVDDGVVTCDFVLADLDGFGEIIQPLIEAEAQFTERHAELVSAHNAGDFAGREDEYHEKLVEIAHEAIQATEQAMSEAVSEARSEVVQECATATMKKKQATAEEKVRDQLRGFSRTIPSFLMAYGTPDTTLSMFDMIVPDTVFLEATGITMDEFRKLRDGCDVVDDMTGDVKHFDGVFDEGVFNSSIQLFLKKKEELASWFDEDQTEDIFNYIPPQRTNQIYTPREVVRDMVDSLEIESPGCFDSEVNTFIDPYMKSGMYITEIVKRLFHSEKLKVLFPDDNERLKHIFEKQVYGLAPTEIIYRIAMTYIFGFDTDGWIKRDNFRQVDAAEYAKAGTLMEKIDELFGA